jgi:hypothetical protein
VNRLGVRAAEIRQPDASSKVHDLGRPAPKDDPGHELITPFIGPRRERLKH